MVRSEPTRKLGEQAESQLEKVANAVREKFDKLTNRQLADEVDQVDKGQDQARRRAEERQTGGSAGG